MRSDPVRSIHVFASDFLAYPGLPCTAGGNRSRQVISALEKAGHKVTFSFPLTTHLAREYGQQIIAGFTDQERWLCEHFFDPEIVLNRVQPEVAVYCNVNVFRTVQRFAREIVHIVDLCGPVQIESFLVQSKDYETAMHDGERLEANCREMAEKLRFADYVVTVSERQKYFWAAYCSVAGFALRDIDALVCQCAFDIPPVDQRNPSPRLSMVYASGFYPWQNPRRSLLSLVEILDKIEGAVLHIFGAPHAGVPNADEALRLIEHLRSHACVNYHGYATAQELSAVLSTAWCGVELMEKTIERELAITGSTVHFLSTGTPVIYNDYSTLSGLVRQYGAGWTVPPGDAHALCRVVNELVTGGYALVGELSDNARRLAAEEFAPDASMRPLLDVCGTPLRKRSIAAASSAVMVRQANPGAGRPITKVLTISQDVGALLELRVNHPLRSLQRAGRVSSFVNYSPLRGNLSDDNTLVDAVILQRSVPAFIHQALLNAGIPFLQDVDDNLLANAAYRHDPTEPAVIEGLAGAAVITMPNPRLVRLLEKFSGLKLAQRACITPNALPFPSEPPTPQKPSQLIWIQSDIAALSDSREAVVQAVEDFSCKYRLPVILVGRNVLKTPRFTHQVLLGHIDFAENLRLLETAPTSIGIAPLETSGDRETLDFIAGKSDLKILLFAGYGHPAVYSAAPPYTDSGLQIDGSVVENTHSAWMEALEFQYQEGWRLMGEQARIIRQERHIDKVAIESWAPALESCVLEKPIRVAELDELIELAIRVGSGHTERQGGSALARINSDLLQANRELNREILELRRSLSWRLTAPVRSATKPIMRWRSKRGRSKSASSSETPQSTHRDDEGPS
jgi:glycosyltransferase involved in cell wall biosynthesis